MQAALSETDEMDEQRRCEAVFALAIPDGIASALWEPPWRSHRCRGSSELEPVLACIIGAFRLCTAPMISSEEIPCR
ncbi:MAG: hypothetical protein WB557_22860 [Solirubrobacteraceae bacterium]